MIGVCYPVLKSDRVPKDNYQLFTINYQLIGDRGFPSYFKGDHQESFLDGNPDRLHIAKRLANDDNDISAQ